MIAQIRDYIKTIFQADHYGVGKINMSQERSVGVYSDTGLAQVESIGRNSSYAIATVRILVHWTNDAVESETAARALHDKLRGITGVTMSDIYVQYLRVLQDEPVYLGTDDNGIYEYVIPIYVYYRR